MKKPDTRKEEPNIISNLRNITKMLLGIVLLLIGGIVFLIYQLNTDHTQPVASSQQPEALQQTVAVEEDTQTIVLPAGSAEPQIEDGKDVETGLVAGDGLQIVKSNCTACHSSDLILQNRFTREVWHEKIVWMQETQGLWDLGENEDIILDYLAANYAPEAYRGRRAPLTDIEWYPLENQ